MSARCYTNSSRIIANSTGRSAAENFCSVLPSRSACAAKLYTSPRYCAPDDSYVFSVALSSLSCAWLRLSFASQSFSKL